MLVLVPRKPLDKFIICVLQITQIMSTPIVSKKVCIAVSPWTGERCKAKAVLSNTVKKGTREFLDDNYCQMHQPGRESKKKCICPHCTYHRSRERYNHPTLEAQFVKEESKFGKKKKTLKNK